MRGYDHAYRARTEAESPCGARLGGFEPEPLGCGVALELLEPAAQARAVGCGRDAQGVTLVIRRGPGADVGERDGGGLRFRAGWAERGPKPARPEASDSACPIRRRKRAGMELVADVVSLFVFIMRFLSYAGQCLLPVGAHGITSR